MQTRALGNTGYQVSAVGLGGMPLSLEGRPPESNAIRVIHAALGAGMRLIDTADVYCVDEGDIGHNERLISKALSQWGGRKSEVVVATKGGLVRPRGDWVSDARPAHLVQACERSLRALGIERIALYQLHAPDPKVTLEDSVGALATLQKQGKIEHVGLSNVSTQEVKAAQGIVRIASVQNRCNIADLSSFEDGVVAHCEKENIAFLAYSPVGGSRGRTGLANHAVLQTIAKSHGVTSYQVMLAWLLAQSAALIPIPGASRVESATSSAAAADLKLTAEDIQKINQLAHR